MSFRFEGLQPEYALSAPTPYSPLLQVSCGSAAQFLDRENACMHALLSRYLVARHTRRGT